MLKNTPVQVYMILLVRWEPVQRAREPVSPPWSETVRNRPKLQYRSATCVLSLHVITLEYNSSGGMVRGLCTRRWGGAVESNLVLNVGCVNRVLICET